MIFGFEINTHLICEILAFSIGFQLYASAKKRNSSSDQFTKEQRLVLLLAATLGGFIFSRFIGALENLGEWKTSSNPWLYLFSVKTIAGGFMGGWLFVELTKLVLKTPHSSGDIMVYPIIGAIIIGRLGCFSQGINDMTHGNPTNWISGMDLGDGVMRHPLALYEIIVVATIGLFIFLWEKRRSFNEGWKFKSLMLLYFFYRFIAEYMKPSHPLFLGMTSIQLGVILTYLLNLNSLIKLLKR